GTFETLLSRGPAGLQPAVTEPSPKTAVSISFSFLPRLRKASSKIIFPAVRQSCQAQQLLDLQAVRGSMRLSHIEARNFRYCDRILLAGEQLHFIACADCAFASYRQIEAEPSARKEAFDHAVVLELQA